MTPKNAKPLAGDQGGEQLGLRNELTMISDILPRNAQKSQIEDELSESLDIASEWLARLFASDDDADQWRLAYLWPEYLRQRQLWVEVRQ